MKIEIIDISYCACFKSDWRCGIAFKGFTISVSPEILGLKKFGSLKRCIEGLDEVLRQMNLKYHISLVNIENNKEEEIARNKRFKTESKERYGSQEVNRKAGRLKLNKLTSEIKRISQEKGLVCVTFAGEKYLIPKKFRTALSGVLNKQRSELTLKNSSIVGRGETSSNINQ